MAEIQSYLDGIESQHQKSPKYMSMVTALLEKLNDVHRVIEDIPRQFSLEDAVGKQLDTLGELVGIDRRYYLADIPDAAELLDDESFRQVIAIKAVQNQWNGRGASFAEIWDAALGGVVEAKWNDNQDMSVEIDLIGKVPYNLIRLIQRGYYIPRPMGVKLTVSITERDYAGNAGAWMSARALSISGEMLAVAQNSNMEGSSNVE